MNIRDNRIVVADSPEIKTLVLKAGDAMTLKEEAGRKAREASIAEAAARGELAVAVSVALFGIKVGDVIEYDHERWRQTTQKRRMIVVTIWVRANDDGTIEVHGYKGQRIRADGTAGTREDFCHEPEKARRVEK